MNIKHLFLLLSSLALRAGCSTGTGKPDAAPHNGWGECQIDRDDHTPPKSNTSHEVYDWKADIRPSEKIMGRTP